MLNRSQSFGASRVNSVQDVQNSQRDKAKASSAPASPKSTIPSQPFKDTAAGNAIRKNLLTYAATTAHAKLEKQLLSKSLTAADMLPGDVLLRYESPTEPSPRTEEIQMQPKLNGIPSPENFGDFRNAHVLMWAKNPKNPGNTEARGMGEPQVVDARAGIGGKNILSAQPTALQAGTYWVYRPTDAHLGDVAAQIGMRWADEGQVPYSVPELSQMGKPTGDFIKFDEKAKEAAVSFARDAFEANPEWAKNPPGTHGKEMQNGATCSSFIPKTYQPAKLRIELARKMEAGDTNATIEDGLDSLTGLLAHNPNGISPRTLEHLMFTGKNADGSPQFKPIGRLVMKQEDVLYDESRNPDAPLPKGITRHSATPSPEFDKSYRLVFQSGG